MTLLPFPRWTAEQWRAAPTYDRDQVRDFETLPPEVQEVLHPLLLAAGGLDADSRALYDESQPRVPAGQPEGGQWAATYASIAPGEAADVSPHLAVLSAKGIEAVDQIVQGRTVSVVTADQRMMAIEDWTKRETDRLAQHPNNAVLQGVAYELDAHIPAGALADTDGAVLLPRNQLQVVLLGRVVVWNATREAGADSAPHVTDADVAQFVHPDRAGLVADAINAALQHAPMQEILQRSAKHAARDAARGLTDREVGQIVDEFVGTPTTLPLSTAIVAANWRESNSALSQTLRDVVAARAVNILAESGIESSETAVREMGDQFWFYWTQSSGHYISLAMMESLSKPPLDAHPRLFDGPPINADPVRDAYAQAQWETTQYILAKHDVSHVSTYRAYVLEPGDGLDEDFIRVDTDGAGGEYPEERSAPLPNLRLRRNTLQSTTLRLDVANDWGGVDVHLTPGSNARVVQALRVPRTSVFSLPVFGEGVHQESEVVVLGTRDRWWWRAYAWRGYKDAFSPTLLQGRPEES